jgi:hypothetical protein
MQTTVCPKCKAKEGEPCRTPKGKKAETHMERGKRYRLDIGPEEWDKRHTFNPYR